MSMMQVPSLDPGARSLPAELRVPRGNAFGWHRLHGNLTPVTGGGMSGVGYYDAMGDWQPDESPYPVVMNDPGAPYQAPIDWSSVIGQSSADIAKILAITQGGSVAPNGAIYGSPGTATAAAQAVPYGSLNVSGAGVSGILSSPLILLLIGGAVLLMVAKK